MKRLNKSKGYTVIELLIAVFITGVLAAAGFKFYIGMHNQALAQEEISDMQQNSRNTLDEIAKNLRKAGYKLDTTHVPFRVNGDSLYIFFSETQAVDTVLYYLASYPDSQSSVWLGQLERAEMPKILMRKVNGNYPEIFSELVKDITFTVLGSSTVEVLIEVQTSKADEDFASNRGFRTYTALESVNIRNLAF
ncbi:MAG: prepilin-type N-terminal cleavage/methylation domain-containing protein [Candidatus Zixiibacteriota bacterium]|nr:MAG: prepilin-type N-terminal cleavage/methylation domain-containing protein [candidate division Zixibacteria bacterium]